MPPDRAARRLAAAAERAARAGDVEAFIGLVYGHYHRVRAIGSPEEAASSVVMARGMSDQLRARFRSRGGRLWAAQRLDATLGGFLADELADGELDPALFAEVEALKARVLLDLLSFGDAAPLSPELTAAEAELMHFAAPPSDASDILDAELRLSSLLPLAGNRELLARIEASYERAGREAPAPAPIASLEAVQGSLATDEALLEYVVIDPRHVGDGAAGQDVWALLVTADRARVIRVATGEDAPALGMSMTVAIDGRAPIDYLPLAAMVAQVRTAVRGGDEASARAGLDSLGRMLIAPLFENGLIERSHRRLIVVPHRMLHYVPFSALPGFDGEPLCAGFAVTLAPSATVWERLRARPRPPVTRLVAVANPDLSYTNLGSLEASEREIEAIERRVPLPVDARVGAEASESFLRAAVPGAGIVHVATHGDFPEQDALDMQRVLLAADEHHDGALRADELRSLDLSAARAVVLSVCNGGLYRFGPGDEPYGLLPAVLGAGAENVVSTLWPIEDRIGRVFMKELYRDLLTAGPAEALRRTASQFRDDGALIRQWAAFTVVGTGRPFDS